MANFLVLRKTFEVDANNGPRMLVGRQNRDIPDDTHAVVTTMRKHYDMSVDVQFDSNGGTPCDNAAYVLGSTYKDLPVPTKAQHIFNGWFTDPTSGQQITQDSIVELSITKLYAHWEYVQIDSDCTSYSVTTTSSYKKTGIYVASIADSSQPIYIDWGDGAVEKTTSSISQKSHTYETNGNFTVKISNNIASFAPSYSDSTWYDTISQNFYTFKGMISTGSKVTSLPTYAFYHCSAMTNIDFMETCWPTVTSLPHQCFQYCSGLTSIYGAKRFTSLGSQCFRYCSGLSGIQDLSEFKFTTLPNSYTFANCTNVTQWILPRGFNGTTSLGSYMFSNNTKLSALVLPNSLTSTGTYTFQNCSNLNNISIPAKVQSIGNYAFYGCTSLSNVNIEASNLTAIDHYVFYNCSKLAGLDLPDTVKSIGNYAFYGCTSLDYAGRMANDLPYDAEIEYLESDGNQWIDTLINVTSKMNVDVSIASTQFKSARCIFGSVGKSNDSLIRCLIYDDPTKGPIISPQIGSYGVKSYYLPYDTNLHTYKITSSMLIIDDKQYSVSFSDNTDSTFVLFSFNNNNNITPYLGAGRIAYCKIYDENNNVFRNLIPVRVGNVGYMYDKVSGKLFENQGTGNFILGQDIKITSQHSELPSQLTSIGSYAYQGCSNLKSLNIPENLQTIGDYAFAGCYQISSIVDKRLSAQAASTNTFGSATGTSNTAFTGYQTRGSNILSTYFAATGYDENVWNDPLQNPDKCGFVQQYIDPENVISYVVAFDAGIGSIQETTRTIVKGKKIGELPIPTVTGEQVYFCGWSPVADDVDSVIYKDYKVTSDMTLHAIYSSQPIANYEVILNDQWQASSKANPDASAYDGVYESFSNYNQGNKAAVMYIKIKGYSSFTIYIRSYAESNYDYTVAFNLDTYTPSNPLTSNPSSSTSGVKAHTSGKQNSGTTIGSYTKVEYTGIDGNEHYICVAYRKDGSANSGDDRGYVLVEKQDSGTFEPVKYITVNFEVGDGTLVSGEATITDIQGTTISKFPEISAPASRPYFVGWNTQADGSGEYYVKTTILPNQESLILYACYVAEDPNKGKYLCFTAEQANSTIQLSAVGTAPTVYLETYRTCSNVVEGWSDFVVGETTITLDNVGDIVYFRAKQDNNVFATNASNYSKFVMTGKIAASGNLNTLLKADGTVVDLSGRNYCYYNMFRDCTSLTQAPELPAMTLATYCYNSIFYGCTALTQAPELPATTLANYCYNSMFIDCTSLTQAPALPATTLAIGCYSSMFRDCTSLTQAPELPATTLAIRCYSYMFRGCTALTQAPALPATTLATQCYSYMFRDCTSLTQAPELPATTLATRCYQSMFSGCTALTQAPALPATTLANYCYNSMFIDCTSLTQAPALPATALASYCYNSMFYGCASLTKAPELPATTLASNCYYGMFSGCTNLNNINVNFSAWSPTNATTNWTSSVSSSGTFTCPVDLPETYGTSYIPANWEIVRK